MTEINHSYQANQHRGDSQPEHISIDDGSRPMSFKIYEALEKVTDLDLESGPPLGYVVDLDAIDRLYAVAEQNTQAEPPVVCFRYHEYHVRIESAHEIRIVPQ